MYHSYNGKIRTKEAGKEEGKWIIVTPPDDLFNLNIEIDFAALNFQPLFMNCQDLIVDPAKVKADWYCSSSKSPLKPTKVAFQNNENPKTKHCNQSIDPISNNSSPCGNYSQALNCQNKDFPFNKNNNLNSYAELFRKCVNFDSSQHITGLITKKRRIVSHPFLHSSFAKTYR